MAAINYLHDPNAKLDYAWDWTRWLDSASSEVISTTSVFITSGDITIASSPPVSHDGMIVTAWLEDGTANSQSEVTCRITTDQGRTDDRTITLLVVER